MNYSPPGSPVMEFSGKNTGVGSYFLLQGSFLTQGSNLGLLHCRQIFFLPSQPPGYKLNWIKFSSLLHLYSNCFWWLARNAQPPCVRRQLLEARFCFYHVFINEFYAARLPKIWPIYLPMLSKGNVFIFISWFEVGCSAASVLCDSLQPYGL